MSSRQNLGSVSHLLHRAGQCAEFHFHSDVRHVTSRQLVVLTELANAESVTQTALVECTGIDRSTMTGVLERLMRKGLLQRRRSRADARVYSIRITEKGREVLQLVAPSAKRIEDLLLAHMPADRRRTFLENLCSIIDGLNKA
jgi:DNA-binding MarR family transcriptional regulator